MCTRLLSLLALAAVAGLLVSVPLSRSQGEEPKEPKTSQRVKWEYKEVPDDKLGDEGGLAKLGESGWELVHVDPRLPYITRTNPPGGTTVDYTRRIYYFKRPK